jgi:hypothetical protein
MIAVIHPAKSFPALIRRLTPALYPAQSRPMTQGTRLARRCSRFLHTSIQFLARYRLLKTLSLTALGAVAILAAVMVCQVHPMRSADPLEEQPGELTEWMWILVNLRKGKFGLQLS